MKNKDSGPTDKAFTGDESEAGSESARISFGLHGCFESSAVHVERHGAVLVHGTLKRSSIELKNQESWQVLLMANSSRGVVSIRQENREDEERTVNKGEVLIIPPKVGISVEVLRPGTALLVYLSLSSDRIADRPIVVGLKEVNSTNRLFFEALAHLQQVRRNSGWVSPDLTCSIARVFAILVIETGTQGLRKHKFVLIGRSEKILKLVEDFLETHLTERIVMDDLARLAGVSQRQFRRLFRIATDMSPREYIWMRRAAYGKSLLSQGHHNVAEAAVAAGFSDQTHMNRHFKSLYGVPPSTFLPRRPLKNEK